MPSLLYKELKQRSFKMIKKWILFLTASLVFCALAQAGNDLPLEDLPPVDQIFGVLNEELNQEDPSWENWEEVQLKADSNMTPVPENRRLKHRRPNLGTQEGRLIPVWLPYPAVSNICRSYNQLAFCYLAYPAYLNSPCSCYFMDPWTGFPVYFSGYVAGW